jgi:Response regulators consisting of a CheY-like receiver domain and a winged-helix DNA-binding domain
MSKLSGFRNMDFLEQVTTLNDISGTKDSSALPELLELFETPTGDTGIDYMVVGTLNTVLGASEDTVINGLTSSKANFRTLCIRTAGEYAFPDAAEPLMHMAEDETDPDLLMEVLAALAKIQPKDGAQVFRAFLGHDDAMLAAMAMEMAGVYGDAQAMPFLKAAVSATDGLLTLNECDITTWKSIDAMAAMATPEAIAFLANCVHHQNPTARRLITDALVRVGEVAIPHLEPHYAGGTVDQRILACNIVGFIGSRKGVDGLITAFDKGHFSDPNVRYAAFEALGRLGTLKGLICLVDGLSERDELILMAVVTGLERHAAPGVIKTIAEKIAAGDERGLRIAHAVIASKALRLFQELYKNEAVGQFMVAALCQSNDPEILEAFATRLTEIGDERALADLAKLPQAKAATRKALAVDDSKSMLALYRSILTDLGFEPLCASNGQEAYAFVDAGEFVDIVITDMNMPVMDGMELVSKLRGSLGYDDVPILMVTTESEGSQQEMATKTGVTSFLTKPFKPAALKAKIQEMLGS